MVGVDIFDVVSRTDRTPRRANEPYFAFLNRSGSQFFNPVRDLPQSWLNRVPAPHQNGIVGALRSGSDEQFDSAFWELYLHQTLTSLGVEITLHPDLPGTSKHPDFLVHADHPYYLEAVSTGTTPAKLKRQARLSEVEAVLDAVRVENWTLSFSWHEVGPAPLASARVRDTLLRWLNGLDEDSATAARKYDDLPTLRISDAGWELKFTALPVAAGRDAPLVAVRGAGRAFVVDNKTALRRVIYSKAKRYGTNIPHPLVTAVLSNQEVPTRTYDVVPVLYGRHPLGPAEVTDPSELAEDGHWRTREGWRRSHNPHIVVAADLHLYNLHTRPLWGFRTLDPRVEAGLELPWTASVDLDVAEPQTPSTTPHLDALGIASDWCGIPPDFDERVQSAAGSARPTGLTEH